VKGVLTSLANPRVRRARGLQRARERSASGLVLAEGVKVVRELLDLPERVVEIFWAEQVTERPGGGSMLDRARAAGVPLVQVTDAVLERLADTRTPQGVVAVARLTPATLPEILARPGDVLVLAGVQDPGNMGTLIRSAEAAGAAGVVLGPGCADPAGGKAVRAAAGSVFRLPWAEWDGPIETLADYLKAESCVVCVAQVDGDISPREAARYARVAWILGAEGQGVPAELAAVADCAVRVPMAPPVDSLNVAIAGSLLLFSRGGAASGGG